MKRIVSLTVALLVAVTLVACKPKDKLGNTYRMSFGEAKNLNRLTTNQSADSAVSDYLVGTLYSSDYNWDKAVAEGIATKARDFSKIKTSTNDTTKPHLIDELGYIRTLSDAAKFPYAVTAKSDATVSGGKLDEEKSKALLDDTWRIEVRKDLKFVDGTPINAYTYEYSYKQYLSPTLLAIRGNHVYSEDYLDMVNAQEYFYQLTPDKETGVLPEKVDWEDVGFKIVDDYTFEIKMNSENSQWGLMGTLNIIDLVHPENFEKGYNADKSNTTYGSIDNQPVSYGPYILTNWEQDQKFTFEKNKNYHSADEYPIDKIDGPIIKSQSTVIDEFKAGNLDTAGVSGVYYPEFVDNPGLRITPSNQFMRLDFSLDRSRGGEGGKGEPESLILKDEDFRRAIMVGMDREEFGKGPVSPAAPLVGFVSNIHRTKEESELFYNDTAQHKELVEEIGMSENNGYNPVKAKELFDKAYDKLVADGKLAQGAKAKVEYAYYDVESNQNIAKWLKAHFEQLFGTDKFEWINKGRGQDDHQDFVNSGDFDIVFAGLSGGNYMTVALFDMVYGSGGFYDGKGFDIRGAKVRPVNLDNIFDIINAKTEKTEADLALLSKLDANGTFNGTFHELSLTISAYPGFNSVYPGRDEDLNNVVQALEEVMFDLIPTVPLFSSIGATVYSSRVRTLAPAWYEKMGWGGIRYIEVILD